MVDTVEAVSMRFAEQAMGILGTATRNLSSDLKLELAEALEKIVNLLRVEAAVGERFSNPQDAIDHPDVDEKVKDSLRRIYGL